jgi:hypothetical protein
VCLALCEEPARKEAAILAAIEMLWTRVFLFSSIRKTLRLPLHWRKLRCNSANRKKWIHFESLFKKFWCYAVKFFIV